MNPGEPSKRLRRRTAQVAALLLLGGGCALPGKPEPSDRPTTPNEITSFETLFSQNCAGCHGAAGKLGPAPPLNDPLFLQIVPDKVVHGVITSGRAGTPMPAFLTANGGTLTAEQVKILAGGIKSHWRGEGQPLKAPPAYALTEADQQGAPTGSVERGAAIFARACAGCHGPNGKGGDAGAINDPAFLSLISKQAIRRIIITGRPDLGMPNYSEATERPKDFQPLTSAQIDDLVALVAQWQAAGAVAQSDRVPAPSDPSER